MRALLRTAHRLSLAAFVCATATALTACGSSGGLTAAQYRQRAGSICSTSDAQLAKLSSPSTPTAVAPYMEKALAIEKPAFAKLKALKPPSSVASGANRALADVSRSVSVVETALSEVKSGKSVNSAVVSREPEITQLNNQTHAAWASIGVPACAQP